MKEEEGILFGPLVVNINGEKEGSIKLKDGVQGFVRVILQISWIKLQFLTYGFFVGCSWSL